MRLKKNINLGITSQSSTEFFERIVWLPVRRIETLMILHRYDLLLWSDNQETDQGSFGIEVMLWKINETAIKCMFSGEIFFC